VRKVGQRGSVAHIAYGIYRFEDFVPTDRDQFMEAVLRVGPGAYLTHDSVLALFDLAVVNPAASALGRRGVPARVCPTTSRRSSARSTEPTSPSTRGSRPRRWRGRCSTAAAWSLVSAS
jgi:hypothetical protein